MAASTESESFDVYEYECTHCKHTSWWSFPEPSTTAVCTNPECPQRYELFATADDQQRTMKATGRSMPVEQLRA